MLELYFVYNGHCKFFLGRFDNVDDLIEQMEDHQWAFSAITHPRFQKHIGQRTTRFDYRAKRREDNRVFEAVRCTQETD
ncbi:TPA: hypothetical protein ACKAK7_001771 [Streptococcus pneumoniae]